MAWKRMRLSTKIIVVITLTLSLFVVGATLKYIAVISQGSLLTLPSTRILFLGDVMFDRDIRRLGEENGYQSLWGDSGHVFKRYDDVIFNLEGPITSNPSVSQSSTVGEVENTTFTFSAKALEELPEGTNYIAHIGNNHIFDFNAQGVYFTVRALSASGISYFGDIDSDMLLSSSITLENGAVTIISFNEFLGNGSNYVLETIKQFKKESPFIIVYTHWGVEYEFDQPEYIEKLAHQFIDAGADLVVGSHPHVIGKIENYKGKHIYYSLGNFIFDQYWDQRVRCGIALDVRIFNDGSVAFNTIESSFAHGRIEWGVCT